MNERHLKHTFYWLISLAALVFVMVIIGGITRLTHSGLSMVEWKPLIGTIPPLSEAAWLETFGKYQQFPEYQLLNKGMTLQEFKYIFFWEYFHRLFGRLIGLVFAIPFAVFLLKKYYNRRWIFKLAIGFLLGGSQGLLGWYMVKSGLVNNPFVSHYRLAAHLILATVILMYLTWLALETRNKPKKHSLSMLSILLGGLVVLQITWGAFTAGRKAGFGFNTFPLMNGQLVPDSLFELTPFWINFVESNVGIQFFHRWLGILTLLVIAFVWIKGKQSAHSSFRLWCHMLMGITAAQVLLGICTLIYVVPIVLASAHQAVAMILAIACTGVIFYWPEKEEPRASALT
jgi:cytochrome c oxidase assembly protein subunit 15